jgi:uncharacterized delta-60 repeat protein
LKNEAICLWLLQTVAVNFSRPVNGLLNARALALQPDGKILVAGSAVTSTGAADYAVARLNADGSADASFGAGGTALVPLSFSPGAPAFPGGAIALQSDGRIVLAGTTAPPGAGASRPGVLGHRPGLGQGVSRDREPVAEMCRSEEDAELPSGQCGRTEATAVRLCLLPAGLE